MTLEEVEAEIRAALERLRHPCPNFHFDRAPFGDATPHVEGDGPLFDWVVSERGIEHERRSVDGEELLFIALSGITVGLAREQEAKTRTCRKPPLHRRFAQGKSCQDDDYSRLTWMEAHERLMSHLRHDWGARVHLQHEETLQRFPLTDAERKNARKLDLGVFGVPD